MIYSNETITRRILSFFSIQKEPFLKQLFHFVEQKNKTISMDCFLHEVKERPYGLYFILFLMFVNDSNNRYYGFNKKKDKMKYLRDIILSKYERSFYKNKIKDMYNPFDSFPVMKIDPENFQHFSYYYHRDNVPMRAWDSICLEKKTNYELYIPIFYGTHRYIEISLLDMILWYVERNTIFSNIGYFIDIGTILEKMNSKWNTISLNPLYESEDLMIFSMENISFCNFSKFKDFMEEEKLKQKQPDSNIFNS